MNNSFGYTVLENFNGTALAALYSLVYNASYMLPEIIITVIGFILISKIKPIKEQLY
jgi:thiamine transporter ThiT